jgi:hypothetical protein
VTRCTFIMSNVPTRTHTNGGSLRKVAMSFKKENFLFQVLFKGRRCGRRTEERHLEVSKMVPISYE